MSSTPLALRGWSAWFNRYCPEERILRRAEQDGSVVLEVQFDRDRRPTLFGAVPNLRGGSLFHINRTFDFRRGKPKWLPYTYQDAVAALRAGTLPDLIREADQQRADPMYFYEREYKGFAQDCQSCRGWGYLNLETGEGACQSCGRPLTGVPQSLDVPEAYPARKERTTSGIDGCAIAPKERVLRLHVTQDDIDLARRTRKHYHAWSQHRWHNPIERSARRRFPEMDDSPHWEFTPGTYIFRTGPYDWDPTGIVRVWLQRFLDGKEVEPFTAEFRYLGSNTIRDASNDVIDLTQFPDPQPVGGANHGG